MRVVALAPSAPAALPAGRWAVVVRKHRQRLRWDRAHSMPPRPHSFQPATRGAARSRLLFATDVVRRKARMAAVRTDRRRSGRWRWPATLHPPIAPAVVRLTRRAAVVRTDRPRYGRSLRAVPSLAARAVVHSDQRPSLQPASASG